MERTGPQRYNTRMRTWWIALAWIAMLACAGPTPTASPANRAPPGAPRYAATISLRDELRGLLALPEHHWPVTAEHVRRYLSYRARTVTRSNANLDIPKWATSVGSPDDQFIELGGDVAGIRLPVDARKTGQYAELHVVKGTREDIEAVLAAFPDVTLKRISKIHFDSPDEWIAYPNVAGHQLRVIVEFAFESKRMTVHVHYEH
jgi:hypothetical protein